MTTGRQDKRCLAALPLAAKRGARDRPWGGNDREHDNYAGQRSYDDKPACFGCEAVPEPGTQIGGSAKLGVTQNLVDILELNAAVLLHGFSPKDSRDENKRNAGRGLFRAHFNAAGMMFRSRGGDYRFRPGDFDGSRTMESSWGGA
ncbi:hypothetical protein [Bradyrhizobium sp. CCBAU 53421]|uniref:hypothetical protein n=1 Tax=Bradyrhizobium sp. CCBAU 53421 TaxID=1325120 RepID=UPI00188A582F|nr:hypothetical protein [Bradyrhizobium sp. CCBAU 53421]